MGDAEDILTNIRTRTRIRTPPWTRRVRIRTITTMATHISIHTMTLMDMPIITTIRILMIMRTCTESIYMF